MKTFIVPALVASMLLASCSSIPSISNVPTIAQIQGAAVAVCHFLPTVSTIAALLSANPAIGSAEAIAAAICAAVESTPPLATAKRRGSGDGYYGTLGKVLIIGHYV